MAPRLLSWPSFGRLLLAHPLCGAGIALILRSDLGAAPWDIFHVGLHLTTGLSVGAAAAATGVAATLASIAAGVRPGLGTLVNTLLIGVCIDAPLALLPAAPSTPLALVYLAAGLGALGLGSGLFFSAKLGMGPRDSLMLALSRRGRWSLGRARAALEIAALGVGLLLGGRAGFGTLIYIFAIGPLVQWGVTLFEEHA